MLVLHDRPAVFRVLHAALRGKGVLFRLVTGRLPSGDEPEFVCKFLCKVVTSPCNEMAQPGIDTKDPRKTWRVRLALSVSRLCIGMCIGTGKGGSGEK
jgi:hypothetical protein